MPSFIVCDLSYPLNEDGNIEEICSFPGPYDSASFPLYGESFNGSRTTFTLPRIRALTYVENSNNPDGIYNLPVLFFKNGSLLLEGAAYIISGNNIIFNTPPIVTDEIYITQIPNGVMWFEALTTDVYSTSVTSQIVNSNNIISYMGSDSTPSPFVASSLDYYTNYNPYKAFDGRKGIYNQGWVSNQASYNFPGTVQTGMTIESTANYINIDLGTSQAVNRFKIYPFLSNVGNNKINEFTMSANSYSSYRAVGMSVVNGNFVETTGSYLAYRAFDGDSSTAWMPHTPVVGNIIGLDFGESKTIDKVTFTPHGTIPTNVCVSLAKMQTNDYVEVPNMRGGWQAVSNEILITTSNWNAGTAITIDSSSEIITGARYWGVVLRFVSMPTDYVFVNYGVKEIDFYKKTALTVQSPPRMTISGSNDNSTYTTLYTNNALTWGTSAQTFDFVNTTKYRYYKINIPYFTTTYSSGYSGISHWGFDEIELYKVNITEYYATLTINANLAQIEPGIQKLRVRYYDSDGTLRTEYFNVPFWDGYELWADDLNDLTMYYADLIANELDDTGIYQITRDSDGYIINISRNFYGFDGLSHTEDLEISRDGNEDIVLINQIIDGSILESGSITRDDNGYITDIDIELE